MKRVRRVLIALRRDERGVVLILVLMALVVLGALSATLLTIGRTEVQIAANHLRSTRAHFLAEAGVEDAFNAFRTTSSLVSSAPGTLTAVPGLAGPGPTLAAVGSYTVQYQSAGPDTVLVVSTGTSGTGGAQKLIRATMTTAWVINYAIVTNGDLTVSGNVTVDGDCGGSHSNGNLTVSGSVDLSADATASGTFSTSGSPSIGGISGGGFPDEPIPNIDPADFLAAAKSTLPADQVFQMKSDGQILDGNDNVIATLSSGDTFQGWTYQSAPSVNWSLSGNTGYDGTYYFEGNIDVSGSPGSSTTPWQTTLIATGDIVLSGGPDISAHLTNTLFVAGLDMKITGNPGASTGLVAAHEQVQIAGNPTITGSVVAQNAASTSNTVNQPELSLSGNPTITYVCGMVPPIRGPLQILAWGL
ncbi:MAG: hypothetical protein ACE5JD_12930 [Candidatus Methylomirabilia bacterium]